MTDESGPEAGADGRRRKILDAAAGLLEEGGYPALTMRAVAARAGIALGLTYYYFADKHAIFEALMQEHQQRMAGFLRDHPRTVGVEGLLRAMVPPARLQWQRIGRMVAVWRAERTDSSPELHQQRLAAATAQFDALRTALEETAAAEGRRLRSDPEVVPFVWAGLMGLSDLLMHGWVSEISQDNLIELTVTSLVNQITEPSERDS